MKVRSIVILLILIVNFSYAQLLKDKIKGTRADSLRGMLTPLRTCYDVKYYHLDVKINPEAKSIEGSNQIVFKVMQPFTRLQFDLFANLTISKILYKNKSLKFTREYNAVFVEFPQELEANDLEEITVFYVGKPIVAARPPWDGGFVWEKDKDGNPWIGVACEGIGASSWWPNKDHLSDEPDSMLISITVPKGLSDVSNGRLRKETDIDRGWTKFDWFVSYPINNYNVTVNIGKYDHWRDYHINTDTLTLDYYVLPYNKEKAKKQFEEVEPMMKCYEKYLGKYPFYRDGYKLVETSYLGMEHQSAIAYGNKYLPGYAGRDISAIGMQFDYIIIHESGHEWWGNNVSCADIADMWIHESFCTYSENLYVECLYGFEKSLEYINAKKPGVQNVAPMMGPYGINEEGSRDMYTKGALVLNTLRSVIDNDSLWFDILRGIQKEFALKTIAEKDIVNYINKKTGKDFNYFFNQYYKHADIPVLQVKFEMTDRGTYLNYKWKTDEADFNMPIKAVISEAGKYDWLRADSSWKRQEIKVREQDFKVAEDLFYVKIEVLKK